MPLLDYTTGNGQVRICWALEHPVAQVWGHLVAVDHLGEWLGQPRSPQVPDGEQVPDGAELRDGVQLRDGVELVVDHGEGYLCTSQVTELAPGRSLAMTWGFPDEPPSALAIKLDDYPAEHGAVPGPEHGTVLELVHHGLADLVVTYLPGWVTHLSFFEASLEGDPLPPSSFWRIYASVDVLLRSSDSAEE